MVSCFKNELREKYEDPISNHRDMIVIEYVPNNDYF